MKPFFALTALCLFGTFSLHASERAPGGLLPPGGPKPDNPVLGGLARLRPAVHEPMPGWNTSGLPRWQADFRGRTYYLVFDGKCNLEQLVEKNRDVWWWKIRGRAEARSFVLVRKPWPPAAPVLKDARIVTLNVLVVESLETTPLENACPAESARITVTAKVGWFGNSYSREPNGTICGTCKWCPWEGCYIMLNGGKVRLQGLPGDIVTQQGYRGQTLVLTGRLERQGDDPRVPPDVLVVESFRRA
jgi:hypothetical protein